MSAYATAAETTRRHLSELLSRDVLLELDRSLREGQGARDERWQELAYLVHELASPLMAALGYQDLLLADGDLSKDAREQLMVSRRETERARELVGDILFLLRPREERRVEEPQEVDLVALVKECLDGLYPRVKEKRQTLHAELDPTRVRGQAKDLKRLVYNLVGNAIKYTPEGGRVEVRLKREPGAACALLSVVDDGVGIPHDELPLIGSRFFRARTAAAIEGHGLGLAYCREIAETHGGELHVASIEGEGASFSVDLPVIETDESGEPRKAVVASQKDRQLGSTWNRWAFPRQRLAS